MQNRLLDLQTENHICILCCILFRSIEVYVWVVSAFLILATAFANIPKVFATMAVIASELFSKHACMQSEDDAIETETSAKKHANTKLYSKF